MPHPARCGIFSFLLDCLSTMRKSRLNLCHGDDRKRGVEHRDATVSQQQGAGGIEVGAERDERPPAGDLDVENGRLEPRGAAHHDSACKGPVHTLHVGDGIIAGVMREIVRLAEGSVSGSSARMTSSIVSAGAPNASGAASLTEARFPTRSSCSAQAFSPSRKFSAILPAKRAGKSPLLPRRPRRRTRRRGIRHLRHWYMRWGCGRYGRALRPA